MTHYEADDDALEDNNTNIDMFHSTREFPNQLDNGDPLPDGLYLNVFSRRAEMDNGQTHLDKRIGFKRSAANHKWEPQVVDRNGNPYDVLEDADLMSTQDIDAFQTSFAPNPVKDHFVYDNGNAKPSEHLDYTIYGSTGQAVSQGSLTENKPTQLDPTLPKGVYYMTLSDGNSLKFIKK